MEKEQLAARTELLKWRTAQLSAVSVFVVFVTAILGVLALWMRQAPRPIETNIPVHEPRITTEVTRPSGGQGRDLPTSQTAPDVGDAVAKRVEPRVEMPVRAPDEPTRRVKTETPSPDKITAPLVPNARLIVSISGKKSPASFEPSDAFDAQSKSSLKLNQVDVGSRLQFHFEDGTAIRRIYYSQPEGYGLATWIREFRIATKQSATGSWSVWRNVTVGADLGRQLVSDFSYPVYEVAVEIARHGGGFDLVVGRFAVEP